MFPLCWEPIDHYIIRQPIYMDQSDHLTAPITQNGGESEHYLGRLDLICQMKDGEMVLVGQTAVGRDRKTWYTN